jgi:hypothetical protein
LPVPRLASIAAYVSSSNVTRLPTISERLNIFYREIHNKLALSAPPTIAVDAADQPFALVVNLNERTMALGAVFQIVFHYGEI